MKTIACILGVLAIFQAAPAQSQESRPSLSGYAVKALVNAYSTVGLGKNEDAPIRLKPYLVDLVTWHQGPATLERIFEVLFGKEGTNERQLAFFEPRSGKIIPDIPSGLYLGDETVLPGFIAGEIIAVYHYALADKWMTPQKLAFLKNGNFSIYFMPLWSMSVIQFYKLDAVPQRLSLLPAATPSPRPDAPWENERNFLESYSITVLNGTITIKSHQNMH